MKYHFPKGRKGLDQTKPKLSWAHIRHHGSTFAVWGTWWCSVSSKQFAKLCLWDAAGSSLHGHPLGDIFQSKGRMVYFGLKHIGLLGAFKMEPMISSILYSVALDAMGRGKLFISWTVMKTIAWMDYLCPQTKDKTAYSSAVTLKLNCQHSVLGMWDI